MFSCRKITSGYIKKHAHKTLANIQIKSFSLRYKHFLDFTNKYCFCGYHATSSCCQSTTRLQSQYFSQNIVLWETLFLFPLQNITMTNLVLIFHVKVLKNLNISLLLDLNLNISLLLDLKAPILLLLISSQLSYIFPMAYIYNNRWQIR